MVGCLHITYIKLFLIFLWAWAITFYWFAGWSGSNSRCRRMEPYLANVLALIDWFHSTQPSWAPEPAHWLDRTLNLVYIWPVSGQICLQLYQVPYICNQELKLIILNFYKLKDNPDYEIKDIRIVEWYSKNSNTIVGKLFDRCVSNNLIFNLHQTSCWKSILLLWLMGELSMS